MYEARETVKIWRERARLDRETEEAKQACHARTTHQTTQMQQAMTAGSATVGGYKEAVKQAVVQAPPDGDPTGERGDPEPEEQAAEGEQAPAPSKHRAREERRKAQEAST